MNRNEAEKIASAVSMIRNEWLQTSLLTALAKQQHRPARDVALALVFLAYDPACKTPGLLDTKGPHWAVASLTGMDPTYTPPTVAEADCREHNQRRPCGGCRAEAIAVQPEPLPPPPPRLPGESFTDYRHRINEGTQDE